MRQLVKKLNMQVTTANAPPSELGDSEIEVTPLGLRVISVLDLTEDVLRRSGIERGMRVLDLECGAGNASLSIAKLIGLHCLGCRAASENNHIGLQVRKLPRQLVHPFNVPSGPTSIDPQIAPLDPPQFVKTAHK